MIERLIERRVMGEGRFFTLLQDLVLLPDGATGIREWLPHPGAAAIVPILADGQVCLVQQYRYACGATFLEVPAGKIEAEDQNPMDTAFRELQEETGYQSQKMTYLGKMNPTIAYSDEVIHLYLASDLVEGQWQKEAGEFIHLVKMPFWEAVQKAHEGYFEDGKTMFALIRAAHYLKNQVNISEDIA
jgi:ADP-ribose pyrophosphatase